MLQKQKPFPVKGKTDILSGRDEGEALARQVLQRMEGLEPDCILPLDFGHVRFIDFSCADEFLTKVLRRITSGELGTRFIVVQGMSPTIEENIAAVLQIRQFVCPKVGKDRQPELLGKIGAELVETYKLAVRKGRITAHDIKRIAPRVGTSAISNRLTKLQKLGILVRTEEAAADRGGRQYVYDPVC